MLETVKTDHTYKFNVNNTILVITDKTYAGCFRKFWSYFMNYDLDRTVKAITNTDIRTSNSELFIAKNGSKKKNILLKEGCWIYTHLNPEAMERTYKKFLLEWNQEPEEIVSPSKDYETKQRPGLKNIYKKSLAMELVRRGHDLEHTMRNRNNPKYQVFVFLDVPELRKDICNIQGIEYTEET